MSSEIDVAESSEAEAPAPARRWSDGRLTEALRRLARRDILGVNAAVLLFLMVPLAFGYYAKLHWVGYLYPPDSRYYVIMTLRDMGWSDPGAVHRQYALTGNVADSWYFAHSDATWRAVQSRMVYPLFSIPFIWVFGLFDGMIILPMLSLAVALFAVARLAQRLYGPAAALAAGGVMACCGFMTDLAEALTDPVAIGLVGLILLNLPIGRRARGHNLVFLGLLSVLLCLTRQVAPMPAAMAAAGFVWAAVFPGRGRPRRLRNEWTLPAAVVVSASVLTHLVTGYFAGTVAGSQASQTASNLPRIAWHLTREDAVQTIQNDRFLTVLLVGAALFAVLRFKDMVAGLFLGALAGTYVIVIVGVSYSGMRYESVLFPVAALSVAALFHHLAPPALRGGSVGDAHLASTGLPSTATWWQHRPYRVPALGAASALALAGIVGWSATHGSTSMTNVVPTAPSAAAAAAGTSAAVAPVGDDPAEKTLGNALAQAMVAYNAKDSSQGYLGSFIDWRHPMRYRPLHPDDPGWAARQPDGTTVIQPAILTDPEFLAVSDILTVGGSVDPATVTVQTRVKSAYGEDVTFTVKANGAIKHGHATTLYPVHDGQPGIITEFVYDP